MRTDRFETLAETLIAAGEEEFARSLAAPRCCSGVAATPAAEGLPVRLGGNVPDFVAAQRGEGNRREKPVIMKKAPENRGLGVELCPSSGPAQATSSSLEQLSSSGQLFWLRSSSIDSP